MKPFFIILAVIIVIFACVIAGYLMFKKKVAEPIPYTAKPSGKIAIVFYSQSKVRNTALVAEWIRTLTGGDNVCP